MPGNFAIVGSGEYLAPMEAVDRELISWLPAPVRVVCLPTAAGKEGLERIHYWSQLGIDHFTRLGVQVDSVPVIDRTTASDRGHADAITRANFVYLSGGKPDYLYQTLHDTVVWQAILSVLGNGGLLAGCSAGAMIQGQKFFGFPGWKGGFNFWPGAAIIPHYDEIPEAMIASLRLMAGNVTLLGIEANTALAKRGDAYWVLGSGGVTIWNRDHKVRYQNGPIPAEALNHG